MKYILLNPKSRNGQNLKTQEEKYKNKNDAKIISVFSDEKYDIFKNIKKEDEIILIGGDGTLNHFINEIKDYNIECDIYFNTAGTGNDFYKDIENNSDDTLVKINDYINDLPKVIVNGKEYLFINGVGFGIDGYCCEVGDELQKKSSKPVNYGSIAVKGLLGKYKAPNAKVTIDGEKKEFKKVWLAPTMKGRFYGGGIMIAPEQDRLDKESYVSLAVMFKANRLRALTIFPSTFKGKHLKYKKYIYIKKGHHIIVEFDRPTALQIDGETIVNVLKYEVIAK